tara:strand:+ start:887 stop:1069 length:183 start_codon:yes stop_codon:yes gene_type:complete
MIMESMNTPSNPSHLAWAVLSQNYATGRSEVVKITDYADADAFVQNDPNLYYKSGPFVLT